MPRNNNPTSFLFASLGDDKVSTTRKVHVRRLADLLYVCIHKHDWQRAGRAWAILTRCPEFDWQAVWQFGIIFASALFEESEVAMPVNSRSLEYLRILMLRMPQKRIAILREIVIQLIDREEHRQALEELELYLPSFPYQADITLTIYAALLHLYMIFQAPSPSYSRDQVSTQVQTHISECKVHLRRASELRKDHPMLNQISVWLESNSPVSKTHFHETDNDNASESDDNTPPKR